MNLTERRERFRAVLAGDQCVHAATVFDPISARFAEDLGFELGFLPGRAAAATVLGAPDLVLLTLTEFAQQVRRICRASNISLMVDADHGYGNALNVMRTVEELENAGVSALSIEDTALPIGFGSARSEEPRHSHDQLVPLEEGVGKMKAALAARQDRSLVIVGRTSALGFKGIPEAIRRVKAYEKAGVDAIFLAGARTGKEIEAVHAETKLPLLVVQVPMALATSESDMADQRFLAANGVRIASPGHFAFLASVKAVYDTLKALRDGKSLVDLRPTLASSELLDQVTQQSQYNEWIKNFLN